MKYGDYNGIRYVKAGSVMTVLFISSGSIILLLIMYAIHRKKQPGATTRIPSPGLATADREKAEETFLSTREQKAAGEKTLILEAYPNLRGIHHVLIKDIEKAHRTVQSYAKDSLNP